jgi:hypothetical protein
MAAGPRPGWGCCGARRSALWAGTGPRAVEAGRCEAQVEVAERHVAARIGRQDRLLAQPGERPGQFAAAVERGIGGCGHRGVGHAECLRSHAAGELKRLPDDQIRRPLSRDTDQLGQHAPGGRADEQVGDHPGKPLLPGQRRERQPARGPAQYADVVRVRDVPVQSGRQERQAVRLDVVAETR